MDLHKLLYKYAVRKQLQLHITHAERGTTLNYYAVESRQHIVMTLCVATVKDSVFFLLCDMYMCRD